MNDKQSISEKAQEKSMISQVAVECGANAPSAAPRRASLFLAILALTMLLALLIVARLPFLNNPLMGEEGYFGVMAVNDGITNLYDYRYFEPHARFNGKVCLDPILHPIAPYLFSTQILRRIFVVDNFLSLSFDQKSCIARLPYLCTYFLALIFTIAIYLWRYRKSPHPNLTIMLALTAFVGFSAFMVGCSIQPQADGSVGGLMVTLPALLILAGAAASRHRAAICLTVAGFIIGLGRNEWGLALFAALAAALVVSHVARRIISFRECDLKARYRFCAWIGAGLILGNVVSFLLDPWDYVQGLYLVFNIKSPVTWWVNFKMIFLFIWPIIALFLICLGLFTAKLKELVRSHFPETIINLYACALFSGFILSKWPGDGFPRYFGPAVFMLLCAAAVLLPMTQMPRPVRAMLLLLMIAGLAVHGWTLRHFHSNRLALGSGARYPFEDTQAGLDRRYQDFISTKKPPTAPVTFAYYHPDADFISDLLTPEEIQTMHRRGVGPRTPEPGPDGKISLSSAWRQQ